MTETEQIECKVARWYYRRMGLMALLLLGCGAWFLFDGIVTWPKQNHKADIYDAFKEAREGKTWETVAAELKLPVDDPAFAGKLAEVKEGFDAGAADEKWLPFAAARRIPEKPERHNEKSIEGQFHWAYGAFGIGVVILLLTLLNAPKKLTADGEAFFTPGKKRVPFDKVFRIDKRKWDNKGLAYAYYKVDGGGEKKAVIDDLKFEGAGRILERLLEQFDGELIERAPVEDEEEDAEDGEGSGEGVDVKVDIPVNRPPKEGGSGAEKG